MVVKRNGHYQLGSLIEHQLDDETEAAIWDRYLDDDLADDGVSGYKFFIKNLSGAAVVGGSTITGITLYFDCEKKYLLFLLQHP